MLKARFPLKLHATFASSSLNEGTLKKKIHRWQSHLASTMLIKPLGGNDFAMSKEKTFMARESLKEISVQLGKDAVCERQKESLVSVYLS